MTVEQGTRPPAVRSRLLGVDAARGLALLGMMSVHIIPAITDTGELSAARLIASGRSAALFALLAGVGLALATGGRTPLRGRPLLGASVGVVLRALLIFLVGLCLGALDSGVAVILAYYGLLFLVAIPFLGLGARVLLPLAATWSAVAPLLSHAYREGAPPASYDVPSLDSLSQPGDLLRELLVTGYYPVFPWMAYLLAGLGIGRLALSSTRVAATLLAGGAALAVAAWVASMILLERGLEHLESAGLGGHPASPVNFGEHVLNTSFYGTEPVTSWWWLVVASPHTATPFDLFHTIGTSAAVLGLMLLIAARARGVIWPLAAIGGMTFTLYSLHVVLLSGPIPGGEPNAYLIHVAIVFAVAMPWRAFIGRGPLEALSAALARQARELVAPGRSAAPGP
ncbi:heparan-alpha-glucosaminide N-acetyltransferase domain-containing protein [Jiangella gansuensis]|uniref:heparan-alpha-glucosaminide N-acetyltransferase domain-containing protein n=1 Tax=Jiangella gansuensis TaxID=281473 RepID=UPI00047EA6E0|nr:heparan-alpha-glucosaminide N-acetyltransferase domain-containing protein [Jiangella gansuensis]